MKVKVLLSGLIYILIGALILMQTNVALVIASDDDNPITAAITSVINNVSEVMGEVATSSAVPISLPITDNPSASPSATPINEPLTSPVLHEINPGVAKFGDRVNLKSFWNNLPYFNPKVFVGSVPMPEDTYEYEDNDTSLSFILGVSSLLEEGKNYLVSLLDKFGVRSNSMQLTITAPIASTNPSATPSATPSASASAAPMPAPVINTVFPNPATWGTHILLTGSNITNSAEIYLDEYLITPQAYTSASEDGTTIEFTMPLFTNHRANQIYKLSMRQNGVKSNEVDFTIAPSLAYNTATPSAHQVLIDPQVNLDANHTEVLMAYSNFNANISIPRSVTNPTLNFSSLLWPNPHTNESFADFNNALTINANTSLGIIMVEIPTATQITGPGDWNGIMNAPRVLSNTATQAVIEIGLGDTPLTFNKGVRILIPGQAGKLAGFQRGSTLTKITRNCVADSQEAGDNLPDSGDCHIGVGNDLVIWTKHFTKFVTYTQTVTPPNNGSSSQSSSNNGPVAAPVCDYSKPAGAPKLLSAKATGRNEATLTWSKALDPVTYYLVAYGTKSNTLEYGNPNVGGKDTTSYIVKGLNNGKTYYFKVRAGNNCMPGDYSNEIAVKVAGDNISGQAIGFKSGVLGSNKAEVKFKPITAAEPTRIATSSANFFSKVLSFFTNLFNR